MGNFYSRVKMAPHTNDGDVAQGETWTLNQPLMEADPEVQSVS